MRISWLSILFFCILAATISSVGSSDLHAAGQGRMLLKEGPATHLRVNDQPDDHSFLQFGLFIEDQEDNEYGQTKKKNGNSPVCRTSAPNLPDHLLLSTHIHALCYAVVLFRAAANSAYLLHCNLRF